MVATVAVRQDDPLSRRIDGENEIRVDHEAPAQADEVAAFVAELVADQVLDLAELQGHHRLAIVLRHHRRVVAVGRHVNEAVGGDPEEFRALGYDDGLAHLRFNPNKFNSFFLSWQSLFKRMYEINV